MADDPLQEELLKALHSLLGHRNDYKFVTDILEKAGYKYRAAFSFAVDNMIIEVYPRRSTNRRVRININDIHIAKCFYVIFGESPMNTDYIKQGEDWDLNIKELPKDMVEFLEGTNAGKFSGGESI